jgi:hypothetical protein
MLAKQTAPAATSFPVMNFRLATTWAAAACALPALSLAAPLTAPSATRLTIPSGAQSAGRSVAVNETYIAVGAPDSNAGGVNDSGEVLIFRSSDGGLVRRIPSPTPTFGGTFGQSVALHGNTVYVGAPGESAMGAASGGNVHAFNAATGVKLWAFAGSAGQRIGGALAVSGDRLLVGAPAGSVSGNPSLSGSAVFLDRLSGAKTAQFTLNGPVANDRFGAAVAISGSLAAIGAPGRDADGHTDNGVVLLLDAANSSSPVVAILKCPVVQWYMGFGESVAITRETVLVGSPAFNGFYDDIGRVDAFTTSGTFLREFENPHFQSLQRRQQGRALAASGWLATCGIKMLSNTDGMAVLQDIRGSYTYVELAPHPDDQAQNLGCSVAMDDQTIVIGDDAQPVSASPLTTGAVWVLRQPRQPMQDGALIAKSGDAAPGLFNIQYTGFSEACVAESLGGTVMFRASLKGQGVTTGNNSAVFNNWTGSLQELLLRKGSTPLGSVSAFGKPYFSSGTTIRPMLPATISGKAHVLRDTGSTLETDVRTGDTPANASWGGAISAINASTTGTDAATTLLVYTAKGDINGATTANDSRIASYNSTDGAHQDVIREGENSPDMTRKFGQILPRIAAAKDHFVFACALSGDPSGNAALVLKKTAANPVIIAQKGQTVAGLSAPLSTFIGEGVNRDGSVVYRALLAGGTECLLLKLHNGGTARVALKGDLAPGAGAGVTFTSFPRFFIGPNNTVLFTARLKGTGVNSSNDVGVWLRTNSATHLLMREGGHARDCGSALISAISSVELGTVSGAYAITATLTGPAGQNQAAFFGEATATTPALLAPQLNLRKGAWIEKAGGQRIAGITMGTHHVEASGSGSTGRARLVNSTSALMTVKYSDNVSELRIQRP